MSDDLPPEIEQEIQRVEDELSRELPDGLRVYFDRWTSVTECGSLVPDMPTPTPEPHMLASTDPLLKLNREIDTDELVAGIRRQLRSLSRRVGESDGLGLATLVELRDEIDQGITDAITGLRHDPVAPASWAEIGDALGVGRTAAQKRYGHVGGARRPGGQPGNLR